MNSTGNIEFDIMIEAQESKIKELEAKNKELQKILEATQKELEYSKYKNEQAKLIIPNGGTPMTIAELVVRECPDKEWIKTVNYYLECFLNEPSFDEGENNENK